MSELKIITNNHWYEILYSNEIPEKVLKTTFDWMEDPEEHSFFKYRGDYYALSEFMHVDKYNPFYTNWDGHKGDSYFSGVLIRLNDTNDAVQIARYYS